MSLAEPRNPNVCDAGNGGSFRDPMSVKPHVGRVPEGGLLLTCFRADTAANRQSCRRERCPTLFSMVSREHGEITSISGGMLRRYEMKRFDG